MFIKQYIVELNTSDCKQAYIFTLFSNDIVKQFIRYTYMYAIWLR